MCEKDGTDLRLKVADNDGDFEGDLLTVVKRPAGLRQSRADPEVAEQLKAGWEVIV